MQLYGLLSKIEDSVTPFIEYFVGTLIVEFITEKVIGFIFDLTPEKNPILLAGIIAAVVLWFTKVMIDDASHKFVFGLIVTAMWGFMLYGDLTDIFTPPQDPDMLDMILMYLFPTTLYGTFYDAFCCIGSLIATFTKRMER